VGLRLFFFNDKKVQFGYMPLNKILDKIYSGKKEIIAVREP